MKRNIALVLILALALALCACGLGTKAPEATEEPTNATLETPEETLPPITDPPIVAVTPTVVVTAFPVPSSTPEPTPVVAPTPTVAPTPAPDGYAAPTATATDKEKENGYYAYVQGSGINVRAEAGSGDTPIIDVVNIGDRVLVIGEVNGWTKVIFHDKVGYIYSPFIGLNYPVVNNNGGNVANVTPSSGEGTTTIIDANGNSTVINNGDNNSGTGVIIVG